MLQNMAAHISWQEKVRIGDSQEKESDREDRQNWNLINGGVWL